MFTASKFPLLKLPVLCIEDILLQSHSFELIHFSLLSKKCHRIVKAMKTRYDKLYITVTKNETLVRIGWNRECKGNWYFNSNDIGKEEKIIRSIGGCEMKTCIIDGRFYSHVDENIQLSVKAGIEYLMDLFKLPIRQVILHSDHVPVTRRPLLLGFNECREMQILGENPMNHDELRNVIEQFKCTEIIYIGIPIDESFYCDIKSKRINIGKGAKWVTWQQLFVREFATMSLIPCSLQPNRLESFVFKWFRSTQTKLEYLGTLWDEPAGEFNFESLPLMPWSENQRSHAYKYRRDRAVDCSEGMDIQREDGLLATIVVRPKFFFFCVWHTRFHDLTGLEIH